MDVSLGTKADVLVRVCEAIALGDLPCARLVLQENYPFEQIVKTPPNITKQRSVALFERDGYRDRYTGDRLIFPGAMLLISKYLPDAFPTHPNWKTESTHFAYYQLWPVIDHVVPLTRKGTNDDANLVTTSAIRNSAKANYTLDELGWEPPGGPLRDSWDGLTRWFRERTDADAEARSDPLIGRWLSAFNSLSQSPSADRS